MPPSERALRLASALAAALILPGVAHAQLVQLTGQTSPGLYDDLERAAARANQSVFDALDGACSGGAGPSCGAETFAVYDEARELVHTANEILGSGPTAFSLSLDDEGLGDALRWTAAEEVSAQSRVATDFSNGQASSANRRITALRYGATGFSIAGFPSLPAPDALGVAPDATLEPAGAEYDLSESEALGGFLNGAYGWGVHDPTTFEDAFDFESIDISAGLDYRLTPEVVLGVLGGYAENEIDFDASKSIVDGGITSEGFSVGAFGLYEWEDFSFSGFFSYQRMEFEIDRFITYPSFNPDVGGTDTRTSGDTESDAFTFALNLAYAFRFGVGMESGPVSGEPFTLEPSMRIQYTDVRIHAYTEENVDPDEYFALRIEDQDFESLEVAPGLRASVALSTPLGVFFPYARAEWVQELEKDTRSTSSQYAGAGGAPGLTAFRLEGEDVDLSYWTLAVGLQTLVVVIGPSDASGNFASRPLSLFAEYRTVFDLDDIENDVVQIGLRLAL